MTTVSEVIGALEHRRDLYRTLASLYFNALTEEDIERMAARDYTTLMADENKLIASGFNDIFRYLRKRNTGTRQELSLDFTSCFLGVRTYQGMTAAPYESLYLDANGLLMGQTRHAVFEAYKRECVALRSDVDYADDHLSFECQFMAILADRAITALREENGSEAVRLLKVQREFFAEHTGRWFTRFHHLCTKFIETRFYRGVLNITQGFFNEEPALLDELIDAVGTEVAMAC